MPTAAELLPPAVQPPAGYDDRWLLLAAASLAAVAAYYVLVLLATRSRPAARPERRTPARERCLAALTAIEEAAAGGRITARVAHQEVSRVVRAFVEETTELPAATMTLSGLRRAGQTRLAELVAVLYPPEFGPGDDRATRDLPGALVRARELVTTWT